MVVWKRCLRTVLRQIGTKIEQNRSNNAIPLTTSTKVSPLLGQATHPSKVCSLSSKRIPGPFCLYFQHTGFFSSRSLLADVEKMEPVSSPLTLVMGNDGQATKGLGPKTSTVQAIKKDIRQSPKKVNLVAKLVRGMRVEDALLQLQVLVKRAAKTVYQVILSARANASHNHGLDPDKLIVVCRGYGGFGALGHSVYHRELLPRLVEGTWMGKISHLATSGAHTAAITDSGELYTWGRDQGDGRLGLGGGGGPGEGGSYATPSKVNALPVPVSAASCGGFFTLALTEDGRLWSWGANSNYELGRGNNATDWRPKPIPSLQDTRIVQIASGGYHSLALTDKGEVLSWGHGGHGQLGHSSTQSQKVPTVIEALAQEHIEYIACGGSSSAAVTDKGELYMWGNAQDCQLGVSGLPEVQLVPVLVKFLVDDERLGFHQVLSVAVGASHATCLVLRQPTTDLKAS